MAEYKYAFISDFKVRWEEIYSNRILEVHNSSLMIQDKEGSLVSTHVEIKEETESFGDEEDRKRNIKVDENLMYNQDDKLIIASMNLPIRAKKNPRYGPQNPDEKKWIFDKMIGLWNPVLYESLKDENDNFLWIG